MALRDAYESGIALLRSFQEKAKAGNQGENLKKLLSGMSAGTVPPNAVYEYVSASVCPVGVDCAKFTELMVRAFRLSPLT